MFGPAFVQLSFFLAIGIADCLPKQTDQEHRDENGSEQDAQEDKTCVLHVRCKLVSFHEYLLSFSGLLMLQN